MSLQATTQRGAPRWWEGDLLHDFVRSPVALVATVSTLLIVAAAIGAGLIAPYDSNDPASANVIAGVDKLKSLEPILAPAVKTGRIGIVGATYDLRTGKIVVLTNEK